MSNWPTFGVESSRFYEDHLRRPRRLLAEFTATGSGSGRRPGPRDLLWQSVAAFAIAALEAGLEDLVFSAHAARLGSEGAPIAVPHSTPHANPRSWLAESRLMAPSAQKVERVLFSDFGLMLDTLPATAMFTMMTKMSPKGGAGRGVPQSSPAKWADLRHYLDTLAYIRNATAHADAGKLGACPAHCEGALWLKKQDGSWSVQQAHGLTALRSVLAIYNCIAEGLASVLVGSSASLHLTDPDTIDYPPSR
jgi:hypothetical protein